MHDARIEISEMPLASLRAYENNPRVNDHAVPRMVQVIKEYGFCLPILAHSGGEVIDGHLRLKAAASMGMQSVPVVFVDDLSPEQVRSLRILLNASATWARWDEKLLSQELNSLSGAGFDLAMTGFDDAEIEKLLKQTESMASQKQELPPLPEVMRGDVWILGRHRLMCGSSADPADVDNLCSGGRRISLLCTDPPYGVNIQDKHILLSKYRGGHGNTSQVENDDLEEKDLFPLLLSAFENIYPHLAFGAPVLCFSPQGANGRMMMMMMMQKACLAVRQTLVWKKSHATFSLNRLDYDYQNEIILYAQKESGPDECSVERAFYGAGPQTGSVWSFNKPQKSTMHPTTKPVGLIENIILNHSAKHDVIMDPFAGSGSALIAAENLEREAWCMEISPVYCGVIIDRWQGISGCRARLHERGGKLVEA